MDWETPEFVEVKMDAEISAYQQDDGPVGPEPARLPEPRATDE
jgi:hypothetical protein